MNLFARAGVRGLPQPRFYRLGNIMAEYSHYCDLYGTSLSLLAEHHTSAHQYMREHKLNTITQELISRIVNVDGEFFNMRRRCEFGLRGFQNNILEHMTNVNPLLKVE